MTQLLIQTLRKIASAKDVRDEDEEDEGERLTAAPRLHSSIVLLCKEVNIFILH